MALLTARLKQMEDAFNTNTQAFSDGIQMMEAQIAVLHVVLDDVMLHTVKHFKKDIEAMTVEPTIDFNAYLKDFIAGLEAKEEADAAKEEDMGKGLVASINEDAPIIFGGDGG